MSKQRFFCRMERLGLALSFDDVRLKSGYSKVPLSQIAIDSLFSRRIRLRCPIVSSPMDTVTEYRMAIALAMAGGIGIIHRNLEPSVQASQVARVKSYLNACISNPVCVQGNQTIREIEAMRKTEGYGFKSFPVLDEQGRLIGLLTKNDFDLCDDPSLLASAVMTRELVTAPVGTELSHAYKIMEQNKKKTLPLLDEHGVMMGMYVFSDAKRIKTGSQDGHNIDQQGHLRVGAAIGTGRGEIDRALMLAEKSVDVIVIDTAHGDSLPVYETLAQLRKELGNTVDIVVGNVSEGPSAKRLAEAGADGIRVGQGPGSICTTRIVAGIGCPQVTAVYNCASAVEGSGIPVCADGGINNSGDITVAVAAGAHCVMLGRLLAGTDEAPGEVITLRGVPHKVYRGMGSLGAMQDNASARARYGQTVMAKDRLVPEGIEGAVPYKGSVQAMLHQYVEGLRRGMGYVGAATIAELQNKADFHRISSAGLRESHPHDVVITQDAPNYRKEGEL